MHLAHRARLHVPFDIAIHTYPVVPVKDLLVGSYEPWMPILEALVAREDGILHQLIWDAYDLFGLESWPMQELDQQAILPGGVGS